MTDSTDSIDYTSELTPPLRRRLYRRLFLALVTIALLTPIVLLAPYVRMRIAIRRVQTAALPEELSVVRRPYDDTPRGDAITVVPHAPAWLERIYGTETPLPGDRVERVGLHKLSNPDRVCRQLPRFASLRNVSVLDSPLTDAGLEGLSDCQTLESITLFGTDISDGGLQSLAKLQNLRHLSISGDSLTDVGISSIAGCKHLESLGIANLPKVSEDGLQPLSELPNLTFIQVFAWHPRDVALSRVAGIPNLKEASFLRTSVGDRTVLALSNHPTLENLVIIEGELTAASLKHIEKSSSLKVVRLEYLDLPVDAINEFRATRPDLELRVGP